MNKPTPKSDQLRQMRERRYADNGKQPKAKAAIVAKLVRQISRKTGKRPRQ